MKHLRLFNEKMSWINDSDINLMSVNISQYLIDCEDDSSNNTYNEIADLLENLNIDGDFQDIEYFYSSDSVEKAIRQISEYGRDTDRDILLILYRVILRHNKHTLSKEEIEDLFLDIKENLRFKVNIKRIGEQLDYLILIENIPNGDITKIFNTIWDSVSKRLSVDYFIKNVEIKDTRKNWEPLAISKGIKEKSNIVVIISKLEN